MKKILFLLSLVLTISFSAEASVRFEVTDLSSRAVRLTYEIVDHQAGNTIFVFPQGGFIHDATRELFKVESVFEKSTKQELDYEVVETAEKGLPQLRIVYPEPIKEGEEKQLVITVQLNLPEKDLTKDTAGRYVFAYETSHEFEFVVPENQYAVYTNHPVYLYERGSNVILSQMDQKFREIVIKTRPMNQ